VIEAATSEADSAGAAAPGERPTPPPEPGGGETREREAGEGIGLSIVKRLCELLDATIELTTEAERGATFRIVLPVRYD
jgi:hypothetical protein